MRLLILSYIKDLLIIGMALAFLWHFSNVLRFGSHIIHEPNQAMLISEVVVLVGILVFGICMAIWDCKRR